MFLKTLLPECRDVECNKASILSCAARTLDKYVQMHNQVMHVNGVLERENKKLLKIIERLESDNTKYRQQLGGQGTYYPISIEYSPVFLFPTSQPNLQPRDKRSTT
jgi:hypothetical protein